MEGSELAVLTGSRYEIIRNLASTVDGTSMPNSLEFPVSPCHIIPLRHFPLLAPVGEFGNPVKCRYCNLYMYKSYKTVSQGSTYTVALKGELIACFYSVLFLTGKLNNRSHEQWNIRSRDTTWQIPVISIEHVIIIRSILSALDG